MKGIGIRLDNYDVVRIEPVFEDAVRIRCTTDGIFRQSLMERYGFVDTESLPEVPFEATEDDAGTKIDFGGLRLSVRRDGVMRFETQNGEAIVSGIEPISPRDGNGVGARLRVKEAERFYGGGYRPQQSVECSGQIFKNDCAHVINNGPSPWFMSSAGWGIFWNITYEHFFDVKYTKPDELVLWSAEGELDIFLFTGSLVHMVDRYTRVTGRPALMPLFGYGITTVDHESDTEYTLLDKTERFRRERIPMDAYSLGPEWMSVYYDMSLKQDFNLDRYHVRPWMKKEQTFIDALLRQGVKTILWTPCNYDLTYEAERRYLEAHPEEAPQPLYTRSVFKTDDTGHLIDANSGAWKDENIKVYDRLDKITDPTEPWYKHLERFFDLGVVGIAEDGATVQATHIDRLYGNGRSDREMHNLNQSLNAQQYYLGYREHTGKRIMVRTPSTYVGHQRYCGTWCGDTTSGTSLVGLVKYSFQGQSNVTADLISWDLEQIHMGMLLPWTLHFCWCHMLWPWLLDDKRRKAFGEYARLRYSLLPYIYTAAWQAHRTGLALCRAMVLMFPDDPNTWDMFKQYMLGDSLLVGAMSREVYLPEGKWIDFWTGKEYEGGRWLDAGYPEDKGGYLLIRRGAILPFWPEVQYVGERVIDELTVRFYPSGKEDRYELYEDDGESYEYEEGKFALTGFACRPVPDGLEITVTKPEGRYTGMPESRVFHAEVYTERPAAVSCEGWRYDEARGAVCFDIRDGGTVRLTGICGRSGEDA